MRYLFAYLVFLLLISAGVFYVMSSALTGMTRRDCAAGVASACQYLKSQR
jgi:hypothetical protein